MQQPTGCSGPADRVEFSKTLCQTNGLSQSGYTTLALTKVVLQWAEPSVTLTRNPNPRPQGEGKARGAAPHKERKKRERGEDEGRRAAEGEK